MAGDEKGGVDEAKSDQCVGSSTKKKESPPPFFC